MNDNYRIRTVCLTFTVRCCCKICPLTADSPLPLGLPLPGSVCTRESFFIPPYFSDSFSCQFLFRFQTLHTISANKVSPDVLNVCDEVWKMYGQESWTHTLWYIFKDGGVGFSSSGGRSLEIPEVKLLRWVRMRGSGKQWPSLFPSLHSISHLLWYVCLLHPFCPSFRPHPLLLPGPPQCPCSP